MAQNDPLQLDIAKELKEFGIKENVTDEIDQDYQKLLNEINSDNNGLSEKFREDLNKIFIVLQNSMSNEKKYLNLYKELKKQKGEAELKYQKFIKQYADLEKDMNQAKTKFVALQEEKLQLIEQEKQREQNLKNEYEENKIKEDYSIEDTAIEKLEKDRDNWRNRYDQQAKVLSAIEKEKADYFNINLEFEKEIKALKQENINLKELTTKLQSAKDTYMNDFKSAQSENETHKEQKAKTDKDLAEKKKRIEELEKEYEELFRKNEDTSNIVDKYKKENHTLLKIQGKLKDDLVLRGEDIVKLKNKIKDYEDKVKEIEKDRAQILKDHHSEKLKGKSILNEVERGNKKYEKLFLEKCELEKIAKLLEEEKATYKIKCEKFTKDIEISGLEKAKLMKDIQNKIQEIDGLKTDIENNKKELESSNTKNENYKKELEAAQNLNNELEKKRNKISMENSRAKSDIDHLQEDQRLKDNRIQELSKKVAELEKQKKLQRELYDSVRKDKNLYFKNLIETQNDMVDKDAQLGRNKQDMDQLKIDNKKQESTINDMNQKASAQLNELKKRKNEIEKNQVEITKKNIQITSLEKEIEALKIKVEETSKEFRKILEESKQIKKERDNLSSQIIHRNDEINMLHEKITILTSNLSRGESEHEKIKEEVKEYKRNNQKLIRDLEINKKYKDESIKLARDIISLDKELLREKNLNKALIEEVESSEKLFHRWRKLEGIDPDALEMHYKINLLQKRLIAKTEECVEKEITIQDITKEAANLKRIVNKKPTLEIEEAIRIYKQMLQENSVKMKSIIAERNMFENEVQELKEEIRRDKKEITDYQMKLAEMKNRVNKISEEFKKVKESKLNILPN